MTSRRSSLPPRATGTTADVERALAKRFPAPEWALLFEVGDTTGFGQSRRADAIAMNTWPSRGMGLTGVEIKASRGDWKKELDHPEKSAAIQRFCDWWWIAVTDPKIVQLEELPPTWGLLVLRGDHLVQAKEAPRLPATPPSRGFLASLLRSATVRTVDRAIVDALVEEKILDRVTRAERANADRIAELERRSAEAEKEWKELVEIVGSDIVYRLRHRYGGLGDRTAIARAIRHFADGGLEHEVRELEGLGRKAKHLAEEIASLVEVARAAKPAE
jgi:hypothetical protein